MGWTWHLKINVKKFFLVNERISNTCSLLITKTQNFEHQTSIIQCSNKVVNCKTSNRICIFFVPEISNQWQFLSMINNFNFQLFNENQRRFDCSGNKIIDSRWIEMNHKQWQTSYRTELLLLLNGAKFHLYLHRRLKCFINLAWVVSKQKWYLN